MSTHNTDGLERVRGVHRSKSLSLIDHTASRLLLCIHMSSSCCSDGQRGGGSCSCYMQPGVTQSGLVHKTGRIERRLVKRESSSVVRKLWQENRIKVDIRAGQASFRCRRNRGGIERPMVPSHVISNHKKKKYLLFPKDGHARQRLLHCRPTRLAVCHLIDKRDGQNFLG